MELIAKHFSELSVQELYEIYKLRVSVFIVEQHCPYQDIDELDTVSYHIFLRSEDGIEAQVYARGLYEKCGFVQSSEEFLEDGIPHIEMTWTQKS